MGNSNIALGLAAKMWWQNSSVV